MTDRTGSSVTGPTKTKARQSHVESKKYILPSLPHPEFQDGSRHVHQDPALFRTTSVGSTAYNRYLAPAMRKPKTLPHPLSLPIWLRPRGTIHPLIQTQTIHSPELRTSPLIHDSWAPLYAPSR